MEIYKPIKLGNNKWAVMFIYLNKLQSHNHLFETYDEAIEFYNNAIIKYKI